MANVNTTATRPPVDVSDEGLKRTRRWGLWITLGTFTIGYATGVISGALLYLKDDLSLGDTQQGLVTSIVLLGAMVAAILTGRLADRVGRKAVLGASGALFAIGLAGSAVSDSFGLLTVFRLVLGLGVGVASALVPTYLGEISPPQIRGRMLTLNQLMQTVGMLTAYIVNLIFASSGDWRAMFWVGVVPALLLMLVATRLPDSPSWLVRTGRAEAARDVIGSVAGDAGADTVVEGYRRDEEASKKASEAQGSQQKGLRALTSPRVRPALVVGLGLAALQQFVGINTVLYRAFGSLRVRASLGGAAVRAHRGRRYSKDPDRARRVTSPEALAALAARYVAGSPSTSSLRFRSRLTRGHGVPLGIIECRPHALIPASWVESAGSSPAS